MTSRALVFLLLAALGCDGPRPEQAVPGASGAFLPGTAAGRAADRAAFEARAAAVAADSQPAVDSLAASDSAPEPTREAQAEPDSLEDLSAPPKSPPAGRSSQQLSLAQSVLTRIPDLRAGVQLAAWLRSEPLESVEYYRPDVTPSMNDEWCARTVGEFRLDSGRVQRRTAYFYVPTPPAKLALPAAQSPDELRGQCRLGFVWAEVSEPDTAGASRLGAETVAALAAVFGADVKDAEVFWSGAAHWRSPRLWKPGALAVATAIDVGVPEAENGQLRVTPRVVRLAATGPASGVALEYVEWGPGERKYEASMAKYRGLRAHIEAVVQLAGIGGVDQARQVATVARLFENPSSPRPYSDAERTAFVDGLISALSVSAELPVDRRAASYLAADLLLEAGMSPLHLGDAKHADLRARLEKSGAKFDYSQLADWFVYTNSWAKEAVAMAPDSRAGEMVFLALMQSGFETSGSCSDQGGKGFRTVIARGEQYLRDKPGSASGAEIHLMVARAHSDIVRLANGGTYQEDEAPEYAGQADSARTAAIRSYQAAFAKGLAGPIARDAWTEAWRLIANLTPTRTWFYCVYD